MPLSRPIRISLALLLLGLLPVTAWAHPGAGSASFLGGLLHPLTGLDHALALLAVGLWAGGRGGAWRWRMPLLFLGVMLVGSVGGAAGGPLPVLEPGIAVSALLLLLLSLHPRYLPATGVVGVVSVFALLHGYAHGAELLVGSLSSAPMAGFLLGALPPLGLGLALSRLAGARGLADRMLRGARQR
jgi:urease accessory protein